MFQAVVDKLVILVVVQLVHPMTNKNRFSIRSLQIKTNICIQYHPEEDKSLLKNYI